MYIVPVVAATVVQFLLGFIWYGPLFGKMWGKIHGFDKLSKETQKKMMSEMGPYYALQLVVTIISSIVLTIFITMLPQDWNHYGLAFFFWIGFTVPAQVSAVLFGGTDNKWIAKKIALQAFGSLVCLVAAAAVIKMLV